jgi:hypothetical protein
LPSSLLFAFLWQSFILYSQFGDNQLNRFFTYNFHPLWGFVNKSKKPRSGIPNQLQKHSNAFLDGCAAAPMDSPVANKYKVAHPDYDPPGSVQQKAGSQANMAQGCGQKII